MNIWILNHYTTPPDTAGYTRHFDFARELLKRGHQVYIFASSFNHRTKKDERLKGKQKYHLEKINGVNFIWLRTIPYQRNNWRRVLNMLSYTLHVIPVGFMFKKSPDVILASSPHPLTGLAGYILAKAKRVKFIFEVRDLWPQTFIDIGGYNSNSPVVKLVKLLEIFLYQRAKKIISLLPKASEYITRLGVPRRKIVYIPNGTSPELLYNTAASPPKELNKLISRLKSQGKTIISYTGAHGIANALDTIIEAAKLLNERGEDKIHFLFVGDGPEKERLIKTVKIWRLKNVSFYQSIHKNAIPVLLANIDIAVISSKKTDLYKYGISSIKLFDYMTFAKPIVWAINSVNNPVAESSCGITVPQENPESMVNAIIELRNLSDKERQDIGTRGYDYVMKYHSIPVLTDKLLATIKDIEPSLK